jgi:enterochelin esterase-like enzyme
MIAVCSGMVMVAVCVAQNPYGSREQGATHCAVVGDLEVRPFNSKVFHNTRMLRIWLPPKYKSPERHRDRYPVLSLNDGQDLFDACTSVFNAQEWHVDETATNLIQSREVLPLIIVGIDNAGKTDRPKEYLPFPDETLRPAVSRFKAKITLDSCWTR